MSTEDWLETAIKAIKASTKETAIYVGCDSVRFKKGKKKKGETPEWWARYSVVVVLHNNVDNQSKGCSLFHRTFTERDWGSKDDPRPRMMREAQEAIEVGVKIREVLDADNDPRSVVIHMDINPDESHKSSVAVKEALGWAIGMGFEAHVKPDAWAATHCADRLATRH